MSDIFSALMFTFWIAITVIFVLPDLALYPSLHSVGADKFEKQMNQITTDVVVVSMNKPLARYESVPRIIDIRSQEEYDAGHIPGAQLSGGKGGRFGISTSELSVRCTHRSDILIYSQDGLGYEEVRWTAKRAKRKACYANIYLLEGGLDSWTLSGRSVTEVPYDYADKNRSLVPEEKTYPINDLLGRDKLYPIFQQ